MSGTAEWEWGTPTFGPAAAHSGSYLWGTDLDDYYDNSVDGEITSSNINLSSLASQSAISLSWWQWFTSESGYDYGRVDISSDGGSNWATAWGPAYGGTSGTWIRPIVTVSNAYAVSTFRMRFVFHSDSYVYYEGWYVDDIAASAPIPAACEP
jgi:bacillopeptidase F